jgi:hypothetical protein
MDKQAMAYQPSKAQILSSTALMVAGGVFKLVIKYATSPNVRKWTVNGAPPVALVAW